MKKKTNKIKIFNTVYITIDVLSIILTIISIYVSFTFRYKYLLLLSVFFGAIFLVSIINGKNIAIMILKKIMNHTCPNKGYKILEKEVIYEFKSREKMRHEKNFKVKVTHEGFTGINDKYKWTGESELHLESKNNNQRIKILDQKFGLQNYRIEFKNNKRFNKNEIIPNMNMTMEDIDDSAHASSLHLSTGVFDVTEKLNMHLILPIDLKPHNYRCLEYIHYNDDDYYKSYDIPCSFTKNDKWEIVWNIDAPFYGGRYVIDWDFDE